MLTTRYWYHVSDSLSRKKYQLEPRKSGKNRSIDEPYIARVCVAPSIEHCLTALPYDKRSNLNIYRTLRRVKAVKAKNICDANITKEHWITKKVTYIKVGELHLEDFKPPKECATICDKLNLVKSTLKKWKEGRFVKKHLVKEK